MYENHSATPSEPPDAPTTAAVDLVKASPAVDIFENDDGYLIVADIPGVAEGDVDVRFDRGELVLEATRPVPRSRATERSQLAREFGPVLFRRAFRIAEAIAITEISAKLTNGVLELALPKSAEQRPRQIPVNAG